ncbi:SDR family NAD(P)-dependent oxidoreductase [Sinanaerobacter chloroacetimidivorans]|uniref:SDR family NAD(P)-dependent oxidoreductase n=1 Tax=Sinanaerobacter chloroacetimidivorans TaxID=2818044 RepID=A0A8J7W508_9FIRM|nr:SDR family NAD(P)-dependent oxidoreductase [Sinanaerobacter chloroacetimidivorans]MBR0600589.1 SDR family NAD(P)-dependent oxidoreductase [Sinanaerobacter chloroacetimidivorans]
MIEINLEGKTALVTGCDDHEARNVAELLAQAGARVAFQYKKEEKTALELAEKISRTGRKSEAFFADLSNYQDAECLTNQILASYGKIDILINDMKLYSQTPVMELSMEQWNESLQYNLYSVYHISRCVSGFMADQGKGSIVNITSATPFSGMGGGIDFSASEAAVHGITLAMARELTSKGIRVNAIAPTIEIFENRNDIGRFAVYLASSLADGISGEIFKLDGMLCREGDVYAKI